MAVNKLSWICLLCAVPVHGAELSKSDDSQDIWQGLAAVWNAAGTSESAAAVELQKTYGAASVEIPLTIGSTSFSAKYQKCLMTVTAAQFSADSSFFLRQTLIVPLSVRDASRMPKGATLVLSGKLSFAYGQCPVCGGSKTVKCPYCKKGTVAGPTKVVHPQSSFGGSGKNAIAMSNLNQASGGRMLPPRDVYIPTTTPCKQCNGTGRIVCTACGQKDQKANNAAFETWDIFKLVHLKEASSAQQTPSNALLFLSRSGGTHRCYVLLKNMEVTIKTKSDEWPLTRHGLTTPFPEP